MRKERRVVLSKIEPAIPEVERSAHPSLSGLFKGPVEVSPLNRVLSW